MVHLLLLLMAASLATHSRSTAPSPLAPSSEFLLRASVDFHLRAPAVSAVLLQLAATQSRSAKHAGQFGRTALVELIAGNLQRTAARARTRAVEGLRVGKRVVGKRVVGKRVVGKRVGEFGPARTSVSAANALLQVTEADGGTKDRASQLSQARRHLRAAGGAAGRGGGGSGAPAEGQVAGDEPGGAIWPTFVPAGTMYGKRVGLSWDPKSDDCEMVSSAYVRTGRRRCLYARDCSPLARALGGVCVFSRVLRCLLRGGQRNAVITSRGYCGICIACLTTHSAPSLSKERRAVVEQMRSPRAGRGCRRRRSGGVWQRGHRPGHDEAPGRACFQRGEKGGRPRQVQQQVGGVRIDVRVRR